MKNQDLYLRMVTQKSKSKQALQSSRVMKTIASKSILQTARNIQQKNIYSSKDKYSSTNTQFYRKLLNDVNFYQSRVDQLSKQLSQIYQSKRKVERENISLIKLCEKLKKQVVQKRIKAPQQMYQAYQNQSVWLQESDNSQTQAKISQFLCGNQYSRVEKGPIDSQSIHLLKLQNENLQQIRKQLQEQNKQLRKQLFLNIKSNNISTTTDIQKSRFMPKTEPTDQSQNEAEKETYRQQIQKKQKYLKQLQQKYSNIRTIKSTKFH